MHRPTFCFALAAAVAWTSLGGAQPPARYVGRLANGQFITGATIADWHAPEANPRLDNQPLLDPQNPFRWLRDRALQLPAPATSFIEAAMGDRLPGVVTAHVGVETTSADGAPPHFLVEPQVELKPPRPYFPTTVRVGDDALRRIVWQRRSVDRWEPGTAFYRDGRTARFRSVRFDRASAFLLMDDGQKEASFDELAELHFPARDPWDAYFDELAVLSPQGEARLLQVETSDGLMVTASRERLFPLGEGGPGDPQRWLHGIQPAWCLDMLWVPHRNIVVRRSFAPHEVPLSRLPAAVETTDSPLRGAAKSYQANRNVEGGQLESGGQEYGWGFGVLGASQLRYTIPDQATALQGRVGLDRFVGAGGSIQARIFLDTTKSSPLWQSAPLVGAAQTTDWGNLSLSVEPGKRRELILQIDPLLKNAPAGADPLDIRDAADWLDPILLLDPQKVQVEIARRTPSRLYAWADWRFDVEPPAAPTWRNLFDFNSQFTSVRLGAASPDQPLRLLRPWKPTDSDQWLVVLAEHPPNVPKRAKVEVRASGELAAEWEIPSYAPDPAQQQVLVVPLSRFQNGKGDVQLEIVQSPTAKEAPVFWKLAAIMDEAPTMFQAFEDDGALTAVEQTSPEAFSWETSSPYTGRRAAKINAGARFELRLPREAAIRERPALGEFRFVRFAYRKAGKGRVAIEWTRKDAASPPIRYDAGLGEPSYGSAARVWSLELPDQWIVSTRDLFADFGRTDLVGLTLSVPDGDYACFDHIYLARTEKDFDAIPTSPSPEDTNREARRQLAKGVLDRVVPATVAVDFGGRFSTGVLISREGDVLTAGHAVVSPGKEVTVRLRDGRRLKGKTMGVARDLDLGLVRIDEKGEWPIVEFGDARNMPKDQLYVGVAHKKNVPTEEAPAAHIVGLQRVLQGLVWTDFDLSDWCAGGPLVDKDARLIGIQQGRSQFGGFLYSQLIDVQAVLNRLRNNEVWGVWPSGAGPMFGVHIDTAPQGCRVTEVYQDTPAAGAGLRVGDLVVKIDGRPVRRLDDIYRRLGEMDPGQQVALELRRGKDNAAATVALIPRTP